MKTIHCIFILIFWGAAYLFAQNNADKNFSYLQSVFDRHDKHLRDFMVNELQTYLEAFPNSQHAADAQFMLGKVLDEKGDKYDAFASYLKTVMIFPDSKRYPECTDNIRYFLGKEKQFSEKKDEILRYFNSPGVDSSQVGRYFTYCKMLLDLQQKNLKNWIIETLREFTMRFPNDPRNDQITVWMADTFLLDGDEYQADAIYQKIEVVFPSSELLPQALVQRGKILSEKLGKQQAAIEILTQVTDRFPQSKVAPEALLLMGEIRENKTKDYKGAINDYGKLVEKYPDDPQAYDALWAIAEISKSKLKDYEAAINTLNALITKDSTNIRDIEALQEIAKIYEKNLKDYSKAAETFARLADMFPEYEKAPDRLMDAGSLCEKQMEDYEKAMNYYQLVIDKFPSSKKADEAAKRIEKLREKVPPAAEEEKVKEEPPSPGK